MTHEINLNRMAEKLTQCETIIQEQLRTIIALNDALGGSGSLTTDNLVKLSRLEHELNELRAYKLSHEAASAPVSDYPLTTEHLDEDARANDEWVRNS